jgi:hypothetical protein
VIDRIRDPGDYRDSLRRLFDSLTPGPRETIIDGQVHFEGECWCEGRSKRGMRPWEPRGSYRTGWDGFAEEVLW